MSSCPTRWTSSFIAVENALAGRLLVLERRDMVLRKIERILENLPHHLDIVDTAAELPARGEVGIAG